MAKSGIKQLRALRDRAAFLNQSVTSDYQAFYDRSLQQFFRLPSEPPTATTLVSVTTTASALMTLSMNRVVDKFVVDDIDKKKTLDANSQLVKLLESEWASADLPKNNAFTTAMVVRAAGRLVQDNVLALSKVTDLKRKFKDETTSEKWRKFDGKSIKEIVAIILSDAPDSLQVFEYETAPSIAYWFIDGAINLKISTSKLKSLAKWLFGEFVRQVSLIGANHHALMDPVAMAMAAAGCKRISRSVPETWAKLNIFPSEEELRNGIKLFFKKQNGAGTWEKYFPMFHYPKAGANHCWHVEVLECLLNEFPNLVEEQELLCRLEASVGWLETSRLEWKEGKKCFHGWNSGGQLSTLSRGEPESWATGVVHMFLHALTAALSKAIRSSILRRRGVTSSPTRDDGPWNNTLDSRAPIKGFNRTDDQSLKDAVDELTIQPILLANDEIKATKLIPEDGVKRSALIFGPPGTGKTRFVKAIAAAIGWDFLEITPSAFVVEGLDLVYATADQLFLDLGDIDRAVVFFDEMDAMLQRRVDDEGKQQLTVEQQFMTTCMLPHLAKLYDSRKVLFFFATNHQESFDAAVTRAGRFDMKLFMGPPTWKEKVDNIKLFVDFDETRDSEMSNKLLNWVPVSDKNRNDILTRATFAETSAFFREICSGDELDVAIDAKKLDKAKFCNKVDEWGKSEFTLCKVGTLREQYQDQRELSEIHWLPKG